MLIIIPKRDFPSDLPIINEATLLPESTPSTSIESDSDFEENILEVSQSLTRQEILRNTSSVRDPLNNNYLEYAEDSQQPIQEEWEETYEDDGANNGDNIYDSTNIFQFPNLIESDCPVQCVDVNRKTVVEDMFNLYQDDTILNSRISVKFIGEMGVDGGGLSNEMFTIFWTDIFAKLKYFVGNDVLIPYLPLHRIRKFKGDYLILGRILGHMMLVTGTMPNKMAMSTLHALSEKPDDYSDNKEIPLHDFLLFVTIAERRLIKKALDNFNSLSSSEINRLTSLYCSNNFNTIPTAADVEDQILTIAEKVIVTDTKPFYLEMRNGLPYQILEFLNNVPLKDTVHYWHNMQPTSEKVMNILELSKDTPTNTEEKTFFYLQNFVGSLDSADLQKFLIFVTGSIHMPKKIIICFHNQTGTARRPIVHTCNSILELGLNYDSQQEFNHEMFVHLNDESSYEYNLF